MTNAASEDFPIADAFWDEFLQYNWETKPVRLHRGTEDLIASPETILATIVAARAAIERGDPSVTLRFFSGATSVRHPVTWAPGPADASLDAYAARIRMAFDGGTFSLVLQHVQVYDPTLWMRLRACLSGLLARVGLPSGCVDAEVCVTDDKAPPFAIHKTNAAMFSFVLAGRKRVRVWPFDAFSHLAPAGAARHDMSLAGIDVAPYLDRSQILDGRAGDVLYWPSRYWHVDESDGKLLVSLNVSMSFPAQPLSVIDVLARSRAEACLGARSWTDFYPFDPQHARDAAADLPDAMHASLAALRAIVNSGDLEQALSTAWLNHASASGFDPVPPPAPASETPAIDEDTPVRGRAAYPILWRPGTNGQMTCSANGHAFTLPAAAETMIDTLNTGAPTSLARLVTQMNGSNLSRDDVRELLRRLHRLRAVIVG